jgi:hypothetical protein
MDACAPVGVLIVFAVAGGELPLVIFLRFFKRGMKRLRLLDHHPTEALLL